jgi:GTP-binding protein
VQLLDARHDLTREDLQMLEFLADLGVPTILVATKMDKLPRANVPTRVRELAKAAGVEEDQIIPFSAVTGLGRAELAEAIVSLVTTKDG